MSITETKNGLYTFAHNNVVVIPMEHAGKLPNQWVIPPAAFTVENSTFNFSLGNTLSHAHNGGSVCFFAPVFLPDGVSVVSVTGVFSVEEEGLDVNIAMLLHPFGVGLDSSELEAMAVLDGKNLSPSSVMVHVIDDTIDFPIIDNLQYVYTARICKDGMVSFAGYLISTES